MTLKLRSPRLSEGGQTAPARRGPAWRPVWALHVLIVGLALHNLVMSQLWRAGVRGTALTVVSAWKDVLLLGAVLLVVWGRRGLAFKATPPDWFALTFAVLILLYGILPQSW